MKNTLFFDDTFTPELLENEETVANETRNTIWLHFTTSDATNQKLQITVRSALYEIDLTAETEYNYQLIGQFWATGNVTSIRLVNDGFTSEYIYITFPEILSTDAALQEVDGGNREYQLLGKTSEALDLKADTAVYRNLREYNITTLTRIVQFVFACTQARTNALLTLTLTVTFTGITTETLVKFHLRTNLIMDEIFIPTQTVKNGSYIITICYPVENVSQSDRNQVDVYMEVGEGNAQILQENAIATLTGAGVQGSSKFTGLIECIDITNRFEIADGLTVIAPAESINISKQIPVGDDLTDTVTELSIAELPITDTMTDTVRIINYELDKQRVLEDGTTERVTEDAADYRYTEREHS